MNSRKILYLVPSMGGGSTERQLIYLEHNQERQVIARCGYQRTIQNYRFGQITQYADRLIKQGMERISWK